jgi:hypothetical protein
VSGLASRYSSTAYCTNVKHDNDEEEEEDDDDVEEEDDDDEDNDEDNDCGDEAQGEVEHDAALQLHC